MKTNIQVKALIMSVAAGVLLSACGSGGGGGRRYNNQNIDVDPDSVTWINPTNNAQNVCVRTMFEVQVGDQRACSWQDVSDAFGLFSLSDGPDVLVDVTSAIPQQMGTDANGEPGGCKFLFKPKQALKPFHQYGLALLGTPQNSVGAQRDSVIFTTGDLLGSSCPASDQFSPMSIIGTPSQLQQTNIDTFGTVEGGEFVMDWDDLVDTFGSTIIQGFLSQWFGLGTVPRSTVITIELNDNVFAASAPGSVRVYEVSDTGFGQYALTNPIDVDVVVNGSDITVSAGGSGYAPNKLHVIVVGRSLRSNARVYLNSTYFTSFRTGSF